MVLHFNVTGESRKAMVKAIETELGIKAKYLGMPSAAYEIGAYRVEKDGTLSFLGDAGIDESSRVIEACVMATGNSPDEWNENMAEDELDLTISVPKVGFTDEALENLNKLVESKASLFKKAFLTDDLSITEEDEKISFHWFSNCNADSVMTYTKFITAICDMAKNQKRITAKPRKDENEKYAFRCFLLRLGFIGDEYKADRKILLANLNGSSAFKTKKGEQE